MSSKKSKNRGNKSMFGGTEIKDLEAKVWIIIILVSIILLTTIIVNITPHIVKFFKNATQTEDKEVDKLYLLLIKLFSHFKNLFLEKIKTDILCPP